MKRWISLSLIWVLWTGSGTGLQWTSKDMMTVSSTGGMFQWRYADGFDTKKECESAGKKLERNDSRPAPNKKDAANGWKEVSFVIFKCLPAGVDANS